MPGEGHVFITFGFFPPLVTVQSLFVREYISPHAQLKEHIFQNPVACLFFPPLGNLNWDIFSNDR